MKRLSAIVLVIMIAALTLLTPACSQSAKNVTVYEFKDD
jgi:hypothetical protein